MSNYYVQLHERSDNVRPDPKKSTAGHTGCKTISREDPAVFKKTAGNPQRLYVRHESEDIVHAIWRHIELCWKWKRASPVRNNGELEGV